MKETIEILYTALRAVKGESNAMLSNKPLEHGAMEQTRAILIDSVFTTALGNIEMAIKQLQILNNQLY